MSVRKAHNSGRNHLRNVVDYYQQIGQEKAQSVIDSITSSYAAEGQQAPNMMPPGAFPPPFGFPGHPGMPGMPPPPFGIPPPGAPGAPGMLPRMSNPVPTPHFRKNKAHRRGSHHYPGHYANQYLFYLTAPGAHGLPFPPPFPNAGTPPTGGFPLLSLTCHRVQTCRFRLQAASPTSPSLRQALQASRLCLCMVSPVRVSLVWGLVVRRLFQLALAAWRGILLPLEVGIPVGWINSGDHYDDLGGSYVVCF
ncbi:Zinc finger U1-C type [Penicillium cf. griseofulvum]|nr:Zinc finger U1-C type [Penicillium cf. griseofulvum]